jgi:hypothetical protein
LRGGGLCSRWGVRARHGSPAFLGRKAGEPCNCPYFLITSCRRSEWRRRCCSQSGARIFEMRG